MLKEIRLVVTLVAQVDVGFNLKEPRIKRKENSDFWTLLRFESLGYQVRLTKDLEN
jgi:hypothetical protein